MNGYDLKGLAHRALGARGNILKLRFPDESGVARTAYVPDDALWGLMREFFLLKIYQGLGVDLDRRFPVVVDAGAHVGLFSVLLSPRADRVVAIEASPYNFNLLENNLLVNQIDNVTPVNAALWTMEGEVGFQTSESSLEGFVSQEGARRVPTLTLNQLLAEYDRISLLKLDIEGSEVEVLMGASDDALSRVDTILGELEVEPGRRAEVDALIEKLQRLGFRTRVVDKTEVYRPSRVIDVVRNWSALRGHLLLKALQIAYVAAPISKPILKGKYDQVLLFSAERV